MTLIDQLFYAYFGFVCILMLNSLENIKQFYQTTSIEIITRQQLLYIAVRCQNSRLVQGATFRSQSEMSWVRTPLLTFFTLFKCNVILHMSFDFKKNNILIQRRFIMFFYSLSAQIITIIKKLSRLLQDHFRLCCLCCINKRVTKIDIN